MEQSYTISSNQSLTGLKNQNIQKLSIFLVGSSLSLYLLYKIYIRLRASDDDSKSKQSSLDQSSEKYQRQRELEEQFMGLLGIFSTDYDLAQTAMKDSLKSKSYFLPVGLPNLGNTCYMNALLQSLTGCPLFMEYAHKLWTNIDPSPDENDSIITFRLIHILRCLSRGESDVCPDGLYSMMCQEFTTLYEQQDSHELLVYLQERITKITAKHLRTMTFDEGLASPELLSQSTAHSSESPPHREEDLQALNHDLQVSSAGQHLEEEEIKEDQNNDNHKNSIGASDDNKQQQQEMIIPQSETKALQLSSSPASGSANFISPSKTIISGGLFLKGLLQIKDLSTNKKIGLNPFAGVYLSSIKCLRCGPHEELHRWEVFYDLSLEVKANLYQSLDQYFQFEKIEDYTCIKCSLRTYLSDYRTDLSEIQNEDLRNAIVHLRKMMMIHDLDEETFGMEIIQVRNKQPDQTGNQQIIDSNNQKILNCHSTGIIFCDYINQKIMCLHLKRVCYSMTGEMLLNRSFVEYPEILDLSKIPSIKENGYQLDATYRLTAVIEHFGSASGGHYVAYKKLFPDIYDSKVHSPTNTGYKYQNHQQASHKHQWVLCDDSEITIIDQKDVLKRNAYMLFYERISVDQSQ